MKYNRPHAGASWGTQAKDWEAGVDYDRLRRDRLKRAQDAMKFAGLGAVLCFNFDNIRYVTGTHIGEWARDKFMRYCAVRPADGPPYLWDPAPPAKRISSPWIADNVAAPHHDHAGRAAAVMNVAATTSRRQIKKALVHYGIDKRADRHRHDGAADAPGARGARASRSSTASRPCSTRARSRPPTRSNSSRWPPRWSTPPMSTSPRRSAPARARTNSSRSPTTACSAWARSASSA